MTKLLTSAAVLLLFALHAAAQTPNRVTIKGIVADSTGEKISFATIMLLTPKDSTLANFTRSDHQGVFSFKNVPNNAYLLKISYVGYLPLQIPLDPSASGTVDLGTIAIKPINTQLMEVVIKTAKSTLSIRGDTVEYDASSFKVPPGSTVEDLLRRLPGIEVDAEGNIKAQGQDIRRVFVDGKTFFGDDPKAATKNLGAETISKVQVYDGKSEQAQLTGVEDGKREKTMNLELKEEFKKGAFGKVTAAGGTEDRRALRGNYNRFNKTEQLSFIGYGNNINETGVNWEDYREFRGQNAFESFDNGDFGFNSGGGGRVFYFSTDDSPVNNFDGRGFTENYGGGANYNLDNKKTKFNGSYFYNETTRTLDQFATRQTFLQDSTFLNTDSTANIDFRNSHSIATRLEHNLDSSNLLIVKANLRFSQNDAADQRRQRFFAADELPTNILNLDNNTMQDSRRLSSSAIYRRRFKKAGRAFAVSAGYNDSRSESTENLFSLNQFFQAATFTEQVRQLNTGDNRSRQLKSSALFTEPLSKVWFFEGFYNFSLADNEVDRQVVDPTLNNERIDALSVFFDNRLLYNRAGATLRYSNNGFNVAAGLAGQQIHLQGEYAVERGAPLLADPIDRRFNNLVPNLEIEYEFGNNIWLSSNYAFEIQEPGLNDLQPAPNVNNPAFQIEGNPNLTPERSHSFSLDLNHWNPANFMNIGIGTNYSLFDNQIVYNQTIEIIDSVGIRTTTRPDNVSSGYRFGAWLWSNFPIIKTKLTLNLSGDININQSPAFVNNVKNQTDNQGYALRAGFNLTPSPNLILGVGGSLRFNTIEYSIQSEQNQNIENHGLDASLKWQFIKKTFLEGNYDYALFKNDRFQFRQEVPILNLSVRRLLGEKNRLEVRLATFDLLNRRVAIRQNGTQNFVTNTVASTLARYYMLSLSYNLRGYEATVKDKGWW